MNVRQLSRAKLSELKWTFYVENINSDPGWEEYVSIDTLIPDEEIFEIYSRVIFTEDNYFCRKSREVAYEEFEDYPDYDC